MNGPQAGERTGFSLARLGTQDRLIRNDSKNVDDLKQDHFPHARRRAHETVLSEEVQDSSLTMRIGQPSLLYFIALSIFVP